MLGVGATGLSLARFSRLWPSSGSFVTYISRAIDSRVGLAVAVIALLGYIIGNGGVYVYVGSYIVEEILHDSGKTLILIVSGAYAIAVAIPVVLGVKLGVRVAILMYVFEVTVITIFIVAVLVSGGDHGLTTAPLHVTGGAKDIGLALSLAVLAFAGFEAPAALGEESVDPRRIVPRAILTGILVTGVLYLVASYAVVIAFPNATALTENAAPFVAASERYVSPVSSIVTWLFVTSVTGSFLGANIQIGRVLYSGSREGLWSKLLDNVHPRFHTPWIAILVCALGSAVIGIGTAIVWNVEIASGFVPSFGILGVVTMFIMVNLALIVHFWRERRRGISHPILRGLVIPLVGILILGLCYYSTFQPGQESPYSLMPYFFGGLLAAGILYAVALQLRRPDLVAQAGSIILGERPGTEEEAQTE
jgi:amino acid transporter